MQKFKHILAKSPAYGGTTLVDHLLHVVKVIEVIADYRGLDKDIAIKGAVLHDIGKTSAIFQKRLDANFKYTLTTKPFRHEIASLFFLSLLDKGIHPQIIDMVVAHHRSTLRDSKRQGILDFENDRDNTFELHAIDWEDWSLTALGILQYFGWPVRNIDREEARQNYEYVVEYCENKPLGWSKWKGLLVAADHFASAMIDKTEEQVLRAFKHPDLNFYNRSSDLYPLSNISAGDDRPQTIVTAPTGAGKTDFLIRRCKGRFFYTLPFQASINAMYRRLKAELAVDNPGLDIRPLHASSRILVDKKTNSIEEKALQDKVGSAIKVLTPHQVASIAFGTRGFEAMLIDLMGCDVILDEIHTYSGVTKAIVLKIVEVLNHFKCRIHIGTATMPSELYDNILEILGAENVYQIKLNEKTLDTFDRHMVHKLESFDDAMPVIEKALANNEKVLVVCNRVNTAQTIYENLNEQFGTVRKLLIHSRFKRKDRAELETKLKDEFDKSTESCFVVSTQVVEVSLDINFDLMVTEAAPLDSLIQRFGRIHRKRTTETIGTYRPVFVLQPPENIQDAKPYELDVVQNSYNALPDGDILHERDLQKKLDLVFTDLQDAVIEQNCKFKDGLFLLRELTHEPKSVLLESLEIDSANCITEADVDLYKQANLDERVALEIPCRYKSIAFKGLDSLDVGSHPFIIPDKAYCDDLGLLSELLHPKNYDVDYTFL